MWLTKLEINPDYEEKNKEFMEGLKRKGIKLSKSELAKVLITDDLIRELVQKLDGRKKIISEGRYYQYTYYSAEPLYNQWDYAFRLVWCLDDNNPHVIGVMDCYWRNKYNQIDWPWK